MHPSAAASSFFQKDPESGCAGAPAVRRCLIGLPHEREIGLSGPQAGRKPASDSAPSEFCPGAFLSPLSTYVTHKMLGSQKLRKRILDDAIRVAFYVPCALVEGATGEFRARSFFPDFVRFCPDFRLFTRLAEALGSWGLGWRKGELSDWKKSSVNTIFSVCRQSRR